MSSLHQYDRVMALLLQKGAVTIQSVKKALGAEVFPYRLPTYIWNIKNKLGAKIESETGPNGRVYRLMNPKDFKLQGGLPVAIAASKKKRGRRRGRVGRPPGSKNRHPKTGELRN